MKKLDLKNKKHQTLMVQLILMYWASGDNKDLYEFEDSEERQILRTSLRERTTVSAH